jgi:protein-L-isoaspartate(D-aspartate) O-methyltransferase
MTKINIKHYSNLGKYQQRQKMVDEQLIGNDIRDSRVLDAFRTIPRHIFIPVEAEHKAYYDGPLPIGLSQTISQPYVVALMLEELKLKPQHQILEIGSGSGYVLALLSLLCRKVTGVELEKELVRRSITHLESLNIKNVSVFHGNGYDGWASRAPFDRIILSAAPAEFPQNLLNQLKPDGLLIAPVGNDEQALLLYYQKNGQWKSRSITEVRFVPLRKAKPEAQKND